MEILWPALGICVIVMFVFFVLSQHWQKLLRRQAWTIRRLTDRVRELEEMADPEFRRRLTESAPVPLEQVFHFSFRLSDHFWSETLGLGEEDWKYIRTHGSFAGSIKLERWRSHTVATVTEVLPESKTAQWQTRTLDFYPDPANGAGVLKLWELALARPDGTAMKPPSLELALSGNFLKLSGHGIDAKTGFETKVHVMGQGNGNGHGAGETETVVFRTPLEATMLSQFRSLDPMSGSEHENGNGTRVKPEGNAWSNWQVFYSNHSEEEGWEWHLRVRDLGKKAEWERWKILESPAIPVAGTKE
ncbi:MAG TPA: hypothetical protein VJR23_18490 [Candidatus Acidoferrales bacterium]|nr:hypothetical protein [Candidatus Acidoferrales bacterium]